MLIALDRHRRHPPGAGVQPAHGHPPARPGRTRPRRGRPPGRRDLPAGRLGRSGAAGRARHAQRWPRRSSPGSRSGAWSGPTRCGSVSAAGTRRRARPTHACAARCSMPSGGRCCASEPRAPRPTRCSRTSSTRSTSRRRSWLAPRPPRPPSGTRTCGRVDARRLRAPRRVHPHTDAEHARGLRGVPGARAHLGAPAAVPRVRARRLLRLVSATSRHPPPRGHGAPRDPQLRDRRGVALVLRRRAHRLSRAAHASSMVGSQ